MKFRNNVAALFLLVPAAVTFSALPAVSFAQEATPELRSLQVNSDNGVRAGSRLRFTLRGTPGSSAFVRIRGVRDRIELTETARGVYTGRYVVSAEDRIEPGDPVRATLRRGNRTVTASYDIPQDLGNAAASREPRIERFEMGRVDRFEPGTELRFRLDGAPGATAFVDLPGTARNVPMREVRPGHYEGSYTIRRSDHLDPSAPIVAKLRSAGQMVTANLERPVAADDSRPPAIVDLSPREGATVPGGPVTVVSGRFGDPGGSGVDPGSVRIRLSGRDVTGEAQVSPDAFSYRGPLLPGHHVVDVSARDRAGNAVRRSWSFDVAAAAQPNVQIEILNPVNNGQVDGNGALVRGRTAPYADVNVRVDAVPPSAGRYGVAREVLARTLRADANGYFEFTFNSPVPVPGTRYEVSMTASKADMTSEAHLVLFQRQG
jgi:hypothetical protein